jgi:hypothetical protein
VISAFGGDEEPDEERPAATPYRTYADQERNYREGRAP